MAIRVVDQPIEDLFGIELAPQSNANLIANRRSTNVRYGFREILINFVAAGRLALCPKIFGVLWYDDSASQVFNDLLAPSDAMLDSGRTGTSAFTLAVADFLYIGANHRFGGARFDLDGTLLNNNASTLTAAYSSTQAGGFTAVTITDGTISSSATMGQDGNVTIANADMPAEGTWINESLRKLTGLATAPDLKAYWLRLDTSALLDLVEIEQLASFSNSMDAAIGNSGSGGHFKAGQEYTLDLSESVGAIEHIAVAGSSTTLQVTWIRR